MAGPAFEMLLLVQPIICSSALNLLTRPLTGPLHSVPTYPIMRLARKVPVSDRRIERDRFAVKDQLPIGRSQRCDDLVSTPATAFVNCGPVPHGNVNLSVIKLAWDEFDELVPESGITSHGMSSLKTLFPSSV